MDLQRPHGQVFRVPVRPGRHGHLAAILLRMAGAAAAGGLVAVLIAVLAFQVLSAPFSGAVDSVAGAWGLPW